MFDYNTIGKIKVRRSKFGHIFFNSNGKDVCFFHSLSLERVYLSKKTSEVLICVEGNTAFEILNCIIDDALRSEAIEGFVLLCHKNIFVPFNYNESNYLDKIRQHISFEPKIRVMVLHLTDYCNMKCKYCFIEGGMPENSVRNKMSKHVAKESIFFFERIIQNKVFFKAPSIVFYGGEPCTNWSTFSFILDLIIDRQSKGFLPLNLNKILITNGTLITKEIAEKLSVNQVSVSISLDGPQKINDINRVLTNGNSTYKSTINGFNLLKKYGVLPSISCVVSEASLQYYKEILIFFLEELKIKALGFNHVSIIPGLNTYDPIYEENYADAIIMSQDVIQKYGDIYERRMNHKINNFINRNIVKADCTGCGEQISVSTTGEIGVCQGYMGSKKTFCNSVFDKSYDPNTDNVFKEWATRSPLNIDECTNCPALATCGGGCPRNADFTNGSIWKLDTAFCHFGMKSLEWLVWKCYQK